jgi:hypothetical protein
LSACQQTLSDGLQRFVSSRFQPLGFACFTLMIQLVLLDDFSSCQTSASASIARLRCSSILQMTYKPLRHSTEPDSQLIHLPAGGNQKLSPVRNCTYHTHMRHPFLKLSDPVGDRAALSASTGIIRFVCDWQLTNLVRRPGTGTPSLSPNTPGAKQSARCPVSLMRPH